ncbi:MAG: AsmA family protein, partial [Deltaproteobacteria bacterium]|nr:AsmA family protein [Deltaproteobacteria bacterium]
MRKPVKVALIGMAALIGVLIAALIIVPLVLQERVAKLVRDELNERLDATVDFKNIDLSLLSTFPTLTAEIVDLEITGKGVFEGTTLLLVRSIAAGVDLFSLVGDEQLVVESITIGHPEIRVLVTEDGVANYDILKESPDEAEEAEDEESGNVAFQLQRYRIIDGSITYDAPGTHMSIDGLNHDGSATITAAIQVLASKTTVDALSIKLGRVTYLKEAKVGIEIAMTLRTDEQ